MQVLGSLVVKDFTKDTLVLKSCTSALLQLTQIFPFERYQILLEMSLSKRKCSSRDALAGDEDARQNVASRRNCGTTARAPGCVTGIKRVWQRNSVLGDVGARKLSLQNTNLHPVLEKA